MTKQRRWQLKQAAMGRCWKCGEPTNLYRGVCDEHAAWLRRYKRLTSKTGRTAKRYPERKRLKERER